MSAESTYAERCILVADDDIDVPAMDATGLAALRDLIRRSRKDGTRVILAGVHAQPMTVLARSGLLDEVGDENMTGTIDEALELVENGKPK